MTRCECGCGGIVQRRFINGHQSRAGRPPAIPFDDRWLLNEVGCKVWQGPLFKGYGKYYDPATKRDLSAYRFAYERVNGPVPKGLWLDHLCRNRACVEPTHLEAVTPLENLRRGDTVVARHMAQTHCIHGHLLAGDNLYLNKGHRYCRTCRQAVSDRRVRTR